MAPRVVLIGPPGAGKSSVGRALAHRMGVRGRDTDEDVERLTGRTVADIFIADGEPAFRALERASVLEALAEHDGVLSVGGGAVLDPDTDRALTAYREGGGVVVFLDVSLTAAAPRVGLSTPRPLLAGNPRAQWRALMDARRPVYQRLATMTVLTDDLSPEQVAEHIATTTETADE